MAWLRTTLSSLRRSSRGVRPGPAPRRPQQRRAGEEGFRSRAPADQARLRERGGQGGGQGRILQAYLQEIGLYCRHSPRMADPSNIRFPVKRTDSPIGNLSAAPQSDGTRSRPSRSPRRRPRRASRSGRSFRRPGPRGVRGAGAEDARIAELEKSLRQLELKLAERERVVQEREARLKEYERELAEAEALLAAREQLVAASRKSTPPTSRPRRRRPWRGCGPSLSGRRPC
jgi:hypothetical protein